MVYLKILFLFNICEIKFYKCMQKIIFCRLTVLDSHHLYNFIRFFYKLSKTRERQDNLFLWVYLQLSQTLENFSSQEIQDHLTTRPIQIKLLKGEDKTITYLIKNPYFTIQSWPWNPMSVIMEKNMLFLKRTLFCYNNIINANWILMKPFTQFVWWEW